MRRFVATLALVGVTFSPLVARAQIPPETTLSICASAAPLSQIADSVVDLQSPAALRDTQASTVVIEHGAASLVAASGARRVLGRSASSAIVPFQCEHDRAVRRNIDASGGTVPGDDLIALKAVTEYRKTHTWAGPGIGAPLGDPETATFMETRGQYVLVELVANKKLFPGCTGQENYRVNPTTAHVEPFDGCIEGHKVTQPRLGQLPT